MPGGIETGPPPPSRPSRPPTEADETRRGATLIAVGMAVVTFLLALSNSVTGWPLVVTTVVVFGSAYMVFTRPLSIVSDVVIGIVDLVLGALRLTINVGMFMLGLGIIILVIYAIAAS